MDPERRLGLAPLVDVMVILRTDGPDAPLLSAEVSTVALKASLGFELDEMHFTTNKTHTAMFAKLLLAAVILPAMLVWADPEPSIHGEYMRFSRLVRIRWKAAMRSQH